MSKINHIKYSFKNSGLAMLVYTNEGLSIYFKNEWF